VTPLPIVAGTVKIQFSWSYGTDANVMTHMFFSGLVATPATADLQSFTNLARSSWVTNMLSLQTPNVTLRTVYGTYLGDLTSAQVSATGSNAGTRTGGTLAASQCALVNLKISRRYRGGHPRLYIPAGAQTDVLDPQHWSSGFLTAFATGWNAWVAAMNGFTSASISSQFFSNVSYYHAGGLRATPVVDAVTASALNSIPGTQRRRLRP